MINDISTDYYDFQERTNNEVSCIFEDCSGIFFVELDRITVLFHCLRGGKTHIFTNMTCFSLCDKSLGVWRQCLFVRRLKVWCKNCYYTYQTLWVEIGAQEKMNSAEFAAKGTLVWINCILLKKSLTRGNAPSAECIERFPSTGRNCCTNLAAQQTLNGSHY